MSSAHTQTTGTSAPEQRQLNLPCKLLQSPPPLPPTTGEASAFDGTENPRHLRVILAAMQRPMCNASFPSHNTQDARTLATLLNGAILDPLAAWSKLGIYRLAACIDRLRKLGWPVNSERKDVQNRFGEACKVAQYSLPSDYLVGLSNDAREFASTEMTLLADMGAPS